MERNLFWYPLNKRGLSENEIKHQRLLRRRNAMNPCYQNEAKALLKNAKLVHRAETIACPILMFVSDGKQVSAGWIEHEREFAEQTNARIIYLNCGHYIHYYESERISREIRAFVNPHRYASAQEGKELMLSNTEYYSGFTQNDIEFRMKKSGATMDELLDKSAGEVRDYSFFEKYFIDHEIAKMAITTAWHGYEIPEIDEIIFIKTDMSVEMGNSGYTHGTQIYLNSGFVTINSILGIFPGFSEFFDELLWHEYFHCLSRCNPEFREKIYSLIHFTVADSDFELPPSVLERYLSNPDVEHHDAYATFVIDGQDIDCFAAWITKMDYAQIQSDEDSDKIVALVPTDGSDTYYTRERASNFDEVFGTNTGYVIDPEECMADNFAYAMFYGIKGKDGKGYPNPEIIQGVIDAVCGSIYLEISL